MTRRRLEPTETYAHLLAEHMASTTLSDIPPNAVAAAKRIALDSIGVAWAATDSPGSAELRDFAVREGGAADATLFAFGDRVPAAMAALVNGTLAGALDYDCLHEPSVMHCDIAILPAVLAVAERQKSSGKAFLEALVLGNDLACRMGLTTSENGGWFYSSLYGCLAAAAASAKLLGLDAPGIRNAMGIALGSAGGSRQSNIERSYTKRMQTAFAAQTGVQAALLAATGIIGPAAILEGNAGIWELYEAGDPTPMLDGLGSRYLNPEISLKKFPSCACNHAAAEAALRIVHGEGLGAGDIARARVTITPYMQQITGGPFRPGDTPQVNAQFNIFYSVASVLLRGHLGVEDIMPPAMFDPAIGPMIERIEVVVDERLSTLLAPATVEIETVDGRHFSEQVTGMPGTPEAPLSDSEIDAKFRSCTGRGVDPLEPARAGVLAARMLAVEEVADMAHFFEDIARDDAARQAA
ncbi:MmgE/PrpD family protein [Oceanibacterium hippocampi]|uniref:MmgE/PrpD family protein n=1 Tax=Oceanibacterium hippocampi TaxID=745714 RepID=A0A1Y5TU08_9PROT|nr:MmgE/PrpD family protein [Oceanibacterium hippocampi]SLN72674.1 MmgE/PrpD family protein [Oceanibacterium hippocampi]